MKYRFDEIKRKASDSKELKNKNKDFKNVCSANDRERVNNYTMNVS